MAITNLVRQDFNVYAPKFKEMVIKRRHVVEVERYLFSNYLFVEVNMRWSAMLNTFGVSRVLCRGDIPEPVPEKIIFDLKNREVGGFYQLAKFVPIFTANQRLKATGGLLAGQFCICEEQTAVDRVRVLFVGIGFDWRTEMAVDDLEPVKA